MRRPTVSIDVLPPVDVARIFQSLGEYIAIHEPVLDDFGTLIDAQLIWWNQGYENVRVLPVAHHSKMSEAYFEPELAIEYSSAAWSSGRTTQLFAFTPALRGQYRSPGSEVVLSVLWERVGDYIVEVGSDLSEVRQLGDKLADQRSLVYATERDKALVQERERIARNLHDTVIQQIYASSLALHAVATNLSPFITDEGDVHSRMYDAVKRVADEMSSLILTIRDEIFAVRQTPNGGFRREIEDVVVPIIGPSPMDLALEVEVETLDDLDISTHVRAVLREAVSNAVRHSKGTKVEVRLRSTTEGELEVVVADDGIGMSDEESRSSGLANIEQRAHALGGTVTITGPPTGGTMVSWRVPVPEWVS